MAAAAEGRQRDGLRAPPEGEMGVVVCGFGN